MGLPWYSRPVYLYDGSRKKDEHKKNFFHAAWEKVLPKEYMQILILTQKNQTVPFPGLLYLNYLHSTNQMVTLCDREGHNCRSHQIQLKINENKIGRKLVRIRKDSYKKTLLKMKCFFDNKIKTCL